MTNFFEIDQFDLIVVGAGFTGATIAERAARRLGIRILVIDRRNHIGGNSYSKLDDTTGIEVHPYGTHIFHTNSDTVWDYIGNFSDFTDYRHRVLTVSNGRVYPMPICLGTICAFLGRVVSPNEAKKFIADEVKSEGIVEIKNLEEAAIQSVGRSLYEAFIKGYTWKQWQTDPRELPASIIRRLPVRFTFNDRYFSSKYEGMPMHGYGTIVERMLSDSNISVYTDTDFFSIREQISPDQLVVFTGPADQYYEYRFGQLGWRTVDIKWDILNMTDFQGTSVMNYADKEVPYTRIHEFRHLHPEREYTDAATVISREYSRFASKGDEPYYPINSADDQRIFADYEQLMKQERNVVFAGRLATYRYLDMDQAIGAALKCFEKDILPFFRDCGLSADKSQQCSDE